MALLFSDVVNKYNMQKNNNEDTVELTAKVADFLDDIELDDSPKPIAGDGLDFEIDEQSQKTPQRVFVASVASQYYSKAIEDIANTKIGNKAVRKKNFKQVMQESFFYGSNRFGTNFIA